MSNGKNHHMPENIPAEYTPISMWGYFGYELLFTIPFIGLIFLIVFAISAKNVNLKNFARSYFCYLIIVLIILAILIVLGAGAGVLGEFSTTNRITY
ncbi:MAG: hypothetical protein K6E49_05170 [Lachnospiraceae bacterium]|nr:hypothetical protein [Lachnospiraceae bacterium]